MAEIREGRKERNTDSQEGQLDDSQPMRGMQMGGRDAEVTYGREENAGDAQGRDEMRCAGWANGDLLKIVSLSRTPLDD